VTPRSKSLPSASAGAGTSLVTARTRGFGKGFLHRRQSSALYCRSSQPLHRTRSLLHPNRLLALAVLTVKLAAVLILYLRLVTILEDELVHLAVYVVHFRADRVSVELLLGR
jgi:hypothetical protein